MRSPSLIPMDETRIRVGDESSWRDDRGCRGESMELINRAAAAPSRSVS